MAIQQITTKAAELASAVMSADMLESFLALPLKSQLVGIATFAHIGGDVEVRNAAMAIMAEMEGK